MPWGERRIFEPRMRRHDAAMRALLLLLLSVPAMAEEPAPRADDILVYGRALPQIGIAISGSQGTVGYRDLENRPLSRVGELVEAVPGVIATQHSGTGKANQYFLRGFNLDHGTDFAGFVDGVPVNMPTHGHGQGYLDLNFLIPELVERIDFRKGPYFPDVGDFSAAGTVAFATKRRLAAPLAELVVGSNDHLRALIAGSADVAGGDLLVALEGTAGNGPWTLPERLRRINGQAGYARETTDGEWRVVAQGYDASWRSTDQVPRRAVASGLIDRLGHIDPELGGEATRLSLLLDGRHGATRYGAYALFSDFSLTSNFTYFLSDPDQGDQFRQRDRRGQFGGRASHAIPVTLAGRPLTLTIGGDIRHDSIGKVGLYRSVGGAVVSTVREDRVRQTGLGLYASGEWQPVPALRLVLGLRADHVGFRVRSDLAANSGSGSDTRIAPKAALAWAVRPEVELYLNYGEGHHSNDVRGATIRLDPATGEPAERVDVLVRARGAEAGARIERGRFTASLAAFWLALDSELVFVGDAGATEPNAASRRHGAELTMFWKPLPWLTLDGSAAFTRMRFHEVEPGEDRIPNAVGEVLAAGAAIDLPSGLSGALRVRHFGGADLIEDGSVRSQPTTLFNLGAYWRWRSARLGVDVLNLFDARDSDISYFYASRLAGEPAQGVEDIHFHPVEPRQVRVSLRSSF